MAITVCPPSADLERLFLGGLSDVEVDAIEQHVLDCGSCNRKLADLIAAKDSLAGWLGRDPESDALASCPVVVDLARKIKSLRPAAASHKQRGTSMITISCSGCEKKLSVKEDRAGKKVKCPGCGQVTLVPAPAAAAIGNEAMRTIPPGSVEGAPAQVTAGEQPTHPPLSKPDPTQGIVAPDAENDASLIDFLAPPQAADELGRLGEYRILKVLGHGGMGVVFLGEDAKLSRKVAIKAMLPHLAQSKSSQQRFLREARAAAALEHDHIVAIHHVSEDRGAPYIVMPFLKGQPLDDRLKHGEQLPLADILRIGREVAEGLAAAHATGLVHRDIKPANIWLEAPRDRVKILDFGLARATSQEAGLTQAGAVIGTPAYMAPEQGRGDTVDARCDLFSLGVVLYRLCTGQQPFHGKDTVSTLMAVAMHEPTPPIETNSALPPELSELVMKLLEKDVEKRVASAAEVVHAIQAMEKKLAMQKLAEEKTEALGTSTRPEAKRAALPSRASGRVAPSSPGPSRGSARHLVAVGLIAVVSIFALLGAASIYYWQTNNGIVRIEIIDPAIKVSFDNNGPTITGAGEKDIKLTPGEFGLSVERGDLKFDTDKFILKRGETITLKIEWFKDGKLQVVQGDKVIGSMAVPPVATARYSLRFSNKDHAVELPKTLTLDADKDFTLEGYVSLSGSYATLVGTPSIAVQTSTQPWRLQVYAAEGKPISVRDTTGPAAQYTNRRVHVAGVRAGEKLRLFVDGRLVGTETLAGKFFIRPNQIFRIGQAEGVIDEIRISKVARYDKNFTPAKRFEPDADTLALYHFDEGAGDMLKDSSGNGHHGKIVGAKWVKADGSPIAAPAENFALSFTGKGEHVEIPTLKLDASAPFTLEAFVTRKATDNSQVILGTKEQYLGLRLEKGLIADWGLYPGSTSKQTVPPGKKAHVARVFDGKQVRVFIDGKITFMGEVTGVRPGINKSVYLIGSNTDSFNGLIDEVRFSKMARYTGDFTPAQRFEPDADTLALYHFDEGQGDKLTDCSGNGHHGKIVGAKWVKADGTAIAPPHDGWVQLFNGKDLNGWKKDPKQPRNWSVEKGVLVGSGPATSHLYTERDNYKDFHLRAEACINDGGNSGIFFRADYDPSMWPHGYEAQINSTQRDARKTGSLMGKKNHVVIDKSPVPPGEWFTLEVIAEGSHIVLKVNGKVTANFTDEQREFTSGHIAVQQWSPQTVAEFRKIEIKELPSTKRVNADGSPIDSTPFFNGKDLTGWVGDPRVWTVEDGEMIGRFTNTSPVTSFLYRPESYKDFELSCQVRLRGEGANSGVQFRSQVQDASAFTMKGPQCEIGGTGKTGWGGLWGELSGGVIKAVPRQVYEKLVKHDDFNDMTLRCVGNQVTITLNGTATLDGEFTVIAGAGLIGFQCHNTGKPGPVEVRFRNLRFTDLSKTSAAPVEAPMAVNPPPARNYALAFDKDGAARVKTLLLPRSASITLETFIQLRETPQGEFCFLGVPIQFALTWRGEVYLRAQQEGKKFENIGITGHLRDRKLDKEKIYHVAVVRSPLDQKLFIDGKLCARNARSGVPLAGATDDFVIGGGFPANMREVRVSISARYDAEFTPAQRFQADAHTLALYHMDEGEGDVLHDSSGNGHHGKIAGARWVKADGTPIAPVPPPFVPPAFGDKEAKKQQKN